MRVCVCVDWGEREKDCQRKAPREKKGDNHGKRNQERQCNRDTDRQRKAWYVCA